MPSLIDTPPLYTYPGYTHRLTENPENELQVFDRTKFEETPGFKKYFINDVGDVFSDKSGIFLPWSMNLKLYWRVQLYNSGARSHVFIHRLVAQIFCTNPNPRTHIEVNHLDYDTLNPRASNLAWCTPSQNRQHKALKPWQPVNAMGIIEVPF